uniref:Myoferlin n=1 Tax=Echinostoma caproni TaxID=27848 RepID=A0A183APG9_9TREM
LPTFGPCFVNLYGSPREYSDLPDRFDALNLGKGEGVAYRGRVLLELTTELLEDPVKNEVKPMEADVIARIRDSAIAFEVSIGNHGNKLDDSVAPCASTTPPTNPVYDGEAYNYLPWGDDKPCTVVDSQWEDISYRLCAINMLLKIADRLSRNIEKINVAVVAALIPEEQAQLAIASLDEFILDCTRPLPKWEPENSPETELDKQLRRVRERELKNLYDQAMKARETVVSVEEALTQLKAYRDVILNLAVEPQRSLPDIVIWMLSGNKRVAYHRIPAHEILFHANEEFRGRSCGIMQTINLKKPRLSTDDENGFWKIPAQIRVIFWLGLEKEQSNWREIFTEAKVQVVAETYENQASIMGKWVTTRPPLTRPAWSDNTGREELQKDSFRLPEGWQWDGDWFLNPERSLLYKKVSEWYYLPPPSN